MKPTGTPSRVVGRVWPEKRAEGQPSRLTGRYSRKNAAESRCVPPSVTFKGERKAAVEMAVK